MLKKEAMAKVGLLAKQALEKAGKKAKSTAESTNNSAFYECQECRKKLSWEEFKTGQDQEIPVVSCPEHLKILLQKAKERRLRNIIARLPALMTARNVPLRFLGCSFENFQPLGENRKKNLRLSQQYVLSHEPGQGLFLTGPNGTGKTHLAVAILRQLILRGELNWYFVKTPYLLMTIRSSFKKESSDSEASLIKQFVDYDYLILDELGVEKTTDWSLQTLYLIIDGRSDYLKPTIITSNLSLQQLEDKTDPRIASRIVGMSRSVRFSCDDWRIKTRRKS